MNASDHPHPAFEAAAVAIVAAGRRKDELLPGEILDGHGALTIGRSLEEAADRLEVLDLLCSVWQAAWLAGGRPLRRVHRQPRPGAAGRTPPPIRRRP